MPTDEEEDLIRPTAALIAELARAKELDVEADVLTVGEVKPDGDYDLEIVVQTPRHVEGDREVTLHFNLFQCSYTSSLSPKQARRLADLLKFAADVAEARP